MAEKRTFHLGTLLSITDGKLMAPNLMEDVYDILDYMCGESLSTIQLVRVSKEAKPYLIEQHPWLADISLDDVNPTNYREKLALLTERYGAWHDIIPMHPEDHEQISPIDELLRMTGKTEDDVIVISLDDDELSPHGDITWKNDDEGDK